VAEGDVTVGTTAWDEEFLLNFYIYKKVMFYLMKSCIAVVVGFETPYCTSGGGERG
jgi:hypothetical protein